MAIANDMTVQYRNIAFDLYFQLNLPPGEGEVDFRGELADGGELDQASDNKEEEDSRKIDLRDDDNGILEMTPITLIRVVEQWVV